METQITRELMALKVGQSVMVGNVRAELMGNGLYYCFNYGCGMGAGLDLEKAAQALRTGKVRR